ncbi:MAG: aminomethyl transferase family protein [Clostridiales bacterium]|jgi:glycine cleavage system aminomethyltransferase T|nr:aminomethyl transferase family protein [Eubacteriales bacterium]MDH7565482.1 aminomethyl transferase family protein [Clostridiales bacterium]
MTKLYEQNGFVTPFPYQQFVHSPYVPYYPEDIIYSTGSGRPFIVPYEYTGWRDEQLSWKKTAYLHGNLNPSPLFRFSGPDAKKFLSKYLVNTFEKFPIGSGKHAIACSERGYIASDGVILRTDEDVYETYYMYSLSMALENDLEKYDMAFEDLTPGAFLFQLGGPLSLQILEAATGDDLHDIKFMRFRETSINGKKIRAVRLGMAGSLAYELHGKLEDAHEIYDAIYQAGKPFGIRRLGWHAYMMNHTENGFPQWGYHFDLDMPFLMNAAKILGSGGDETGLRNPFELGWGFVVKFDHDFIGREALGKIAANPVRTTVSLEWNAEDIADVYKSLFEDGEPYKEFEQVNDFTQFKDGKIVRYQDKVLDKKGNAIGLSTGRAYSVYYQRMISQCQIDLAYAKEGTDVIVLWGEPGTRQKEIRAKVARFPYYNENDNRTFDVETVPRVNQKARL